MDGPSVMARTLALHLSRPTEADGDPAILDDDRNLPHPLGKFEHIVECFLVLFDVDVSNGHVPCGVILPGRRGKGSTILPVDQDFGRHGIPSEDEL